MKKKYCHTALLFILMGCVNILYGQQLLFRNYTVSQGLGSNTVWAIAQDAKGYIWFGTKNGLSRFDGYAFKSFRSGNQEKNAIGDNFIHAIVPYNDKSIWIGTEKGVYVLNLETEKFHLLPVANTSMVYDMLRDKEGGMWIATRSDGLFYHHPEKQITKQFVQGSNCISSNQIRKLVQDDNGLIWMATFGEGVDVYDPATRQFHRMAMPDVGDTKLNQVVTLHKGIAGTMWAGTLGGLLMWEKGSTVAKVYRHQNDNSISENIVRAIYQRSDNKVYIGTEKGLNLLDIPTQKFEIFTKRTNDPRSISDNSIYCLEPDREGGLWIGTFFGGLNYLPRQNNGLELFYPTTEPGTLSGSAVSCFLEDKPGFFWVGTENGGLDYFDSKNKRFQTYPFAARQQPLAYHNIHALLKDKNQRLWIGTFSAGVNVYDPTTGKIKIYQTNRLDTSSLSSNNIISIYQDRNEVIWVGTTEGLNVYDQATDKFRRILDADLQFSTIYAIHQDANGVLWVATYNNGLVSYTPKAGWKRFTANGQPNSLSNPKLTCLLDDDMGNLWLGTEGGGLNCFNKQTKKSTAYVEKEGVPSVVYKILKDDNGALWLSTNNGIIKFSIQTRTGKALANSDYLQSRQFNYNAALKANDGKLYFGGINGFNSFYPDSLGVQVTVSLPAITGFQLFNKDVLVSEESPLKKTIGFVTEIKLNHDESVISFEYAAMSYQSPARIEYAYMMKGFDKDWNYVGNQRKATYTNLAPGTYHFMVKATNVHGEWGEKAATVKVVVRPPFYLTSLAYVLYLLVLTAIVFFARRLILMSTRKKNEERVERLQVQREKEFYNKKIEFFTMMAHEIRTPLSLIVAPLEKLMSEEWKPEAREQLTLMNQNSDRLLSLVNQLLDFRRIESDIYNIRTEEIEIISFIHSIHSRFSAISYQKGIRFSMATSINRLVVQADPEALTKILTNLLINAFKFAKSKVDLRVNEDEKYEGIQYFSVSVKDDGNGIPADQVDKIFNPFYKVPGDYNANYGGTGIGLALAKSLAEKHGGRVTVQSKPQQETVFTLSIPYEAAVSTTIPANEQMEQEENEEQKPLILVVEDDNSLLGFIAKSLHGEGFKALTCSNGAEALQKLEDAAVDLIISDIMMPEMDGIELCHRVKANINFSHIPLILLTAQGNSDAEIAGIESGADAYIIKPFRWKHLAATTRQLMESRQTLKKKFSKQPFTDAGTLTTNNHDRKFLEKLTLIIEERITDPQLSVEELSREMAMSRSSLHKKLKGISGQVPNEFIRLIRLKNAAKMLLSGDCRISEVGYLSGFNSASYFSKCFLQQFGVTPTDFLETHHPKKISDVEDANL